MKIVKLPSDKMVNLDHFVSMPPVILAGERVTVMFSAHSLTLSPADAQALYNVLERDCEWLYGSGSDTNAPVESMWAEHVQHGQA